MKERREGGREGDRAYLAVLVHKINSLHKTEGLIYVTANGEVVNSDLREERRKGGREGGREGEILNGKVKRIKGRGRTGERQ